MRSARKRQPHRWLLWLLALAVISFAGWRVWNSDAVQMRFVYMWDYQQDIITYSEKNNIDPFLVAAIIKMKAILSMRQFLVWGLWA